MRRPPGVLRATAFAIVATVASIAPFARVNAASIDSPTTPPPRSPARIAFVRVVLSEQRAYVYTHDRRLIATLLVSTGVKDSTPIGRFRVFSKSAATFYAPNPVERMRWMVRFVNDPKGGHIGFHSIPFKMQNGREVKFPTPVGVAPSSHGCVRVPDADAKWLFDNMTIGTVVVVQRGREPAFTLDSKATRGDHEHTGNL